MSARKARLLLRTLRPRKLANLLMLWGSFHVSRILRRPLHRGRPAKLGIEPTTSCNLRCPECPSGLRSFTRPTGMAALPDFQRLIDEVHPDLVYLLMYFQGEPYLNPAFLDMAAYAVRRGIYVGTSTNGHYLTEENARKTVQSGIQEVIVSIDGATQATYEQYRVGGNLEKVKEGVRRLIKAREEAQSLSPAVFLQFLVVGPNEHEVEAIHALGKELGVDKVLLKTAQIYDFEEGSPLIPKQGKYSRYRLGPDGRYQIKNRLRNQCWKLWMGAEVTWDGRVLPCCFDKDAQHVMGRFPEKTFGEIWRNEAYKAFRGGLLKGRKEIEICRNCSEGTQVWA